MQIDFILALLLRLTAGVLAIQDPQTPVLPPNAQRYAVAAYDSSIRYGIDPFELIGTAANESDFQEDSVGPDGLDCGITQTRVTGSRYSCRTLRRNVEIGFSEAGRELREDQDSCLARRDLNRCRLNRYNSGWNYKTDGFFGRYWLRTWCFETAARAAVTPSRSCRKVMGWSDIARFTGVTPVDPLILPSGLLPWGPIQGRSLIPGAAAQRTVARQRPTG